MELHTVGIDINQTPESKHLVGLLLTQKEVHGLVPLVLFNLNQKKMVNPKIELAMLFKFKQIVFSNDGSVRASLCTSPILSYTLHL